MERLLTSDAPGAMRRVSRSLARPVGFGPELRFRLGPAAALAATWKPEDGSKLPVSAW